MKSILFLTGTRADFGKIKPLIQEASKSYSVDIFATGMHLSWQYGYTLYEITKDFDAFPFINQDSDTPQDRILANTVNGLSLYINEKRPDMIVVHGDRVEALSGAIVGNFNGILTAHIEGGELSGTVDGMIRHSITKLAHVHFCANTEAARRLVMLGENPGSIYAIGSPDIDVMLSSDLPSLDEVRNHYHIEYDKYGIIIYHPVVGEVPVGIVEVLRAAEQSSLPFIAIYPNNDPGSKAIIDALDNAPKNKFMVLPSMRFEYFLTLLKNAEVIVGNSSAGIREAPVYGVPSINVGTRQNGRTYASSVINLPEDHRKILNKLDNLPVVEPSYEFGKGDSARQFVQILSNDEFWGTPRQKMFWEGEA